MVIIGITSQIGMGKSTVAKILNERLQNSRIFDADKVVAELYNSNKHVIAKISELDKSAIVDGRVDKGQLKKLLKNGVITIKQLNNIVHPATGKAGLEFIHDAKEDGMEFTILDIPLLLQTDSKALCDYIVLVKCDKEIQIQRVKARDNRSDEEIALIISNQMSIAEQEKHADFIIDNSESIEITKNQIVSLVGSVVI